MITLKAQLRKLLFGFNLPQEYLCVGKEEVVHPLKVLLSSGKDITDQHLFLGYKPLIIGIPVSRDSEMHESLSSDQFISLFFTDEQSTYSVAELRLKFLQRKDFSNVSLFIFEGLKGKNSFLSSFHQFTNRGKENFIRQKESNINLYRNLYNQVRIAYAIPRAISIVTLGDGQHFNMCPTDINGKIDDEHYVISLRQDGKVNRQVEELRKLCLSSVDISFCKEAYKMGKNHMQPLKLLEEFSFNTGRSEYWKLPLPPTVLAYKELELFDSIDIGIHRLHFFRIVHEQTLAEGTTLAHVHRFYAQWEINRGSKIEFLLH